MRNLNNMGRKFVLYCDSNVEEMYVNHSTFHKGDAGIDLFITNDVTIGPKETKLVNLKIKCQSKSFTWCFWKWLKGSFFKYHSYFLIPRSSISKTPLILRNSIGLIDKAYTGYLQAALYNTSEHPFTLKKGERYLQLANGDLSKAALEIGTHEIRQTSRANGGFGSTGGINR